MCKKLFLIVIINYLLLSGCAGPKHFGPYTGRVIDAETEAPIEGAVVFMKIMTYSPNVGGGEFHFAAANEVLTNNNGEFLIELGGSPLKPSQSWLPDPNFTIYKPGYGSFPFYPGSSAEPLEKDTSHIFPEKTFVTVKLPKLNTREERLKSMDKLYDCRDSDIPYQNRQNCFRLNNEERVALGLKPLPTPKE